jgi:hypothetical protein
MNPQIAPSFWKQKPDTKHLSGDQRETALAGLLLESEKVFLNVYGAQELIPRNEFRQPM